MPQDDASTERDVLVVGAGVSGAAAASACAKKGLSVELIDYRQIPRQGDQVMWVNAEIRTLLKRCGVDADAVIGQPVEALTFWSADFRKTIRSEFDAPPAYVTNRRDLENALIDAATSADVSVRTGRRVDGLEVLEESVRLTLDDASEVAGRFLIAADGARSGMARQLGLTTSSDPTHWCAQCDLSTSARKTKRSRKAAGKPDMTLVLGMMESRGLGTIIRQDDHLVIRVAGPGTAGEMGEHFGVFVDEAGDAGLLPEDVKVGQPVILPNPAGVAIELESHVGKRSLLVGDAGGFVASISYEGVYPGMWSAMIAADVMADAAVGKTGQDILGQYNGRWRVAMADYLRMPNTDLHFLLPLIFSNQQMADRMAAAILSGQNI